MAAGDPFGAEHHVPDLHLRLGIEILDVASHHQTHQLVFVQIVDRQGIDDLAVAHDRHPVGDAEDLVEPVRDVQDRYAVGLEVPDHLEEALDLLLRERGRRLVHDDDLRVYGERLGDLDPLHLGDREAQTTRSGSVCRPTRSSNPRASWLSALRFTNPKRPGSRPI